MGDLVGQAVEGTLYFVPPVEFERVLGAKLENTARAGLFADLCRVNALYMIARAGSGHIGSSFSCLDIVSLLHLSEMHTDGDARDIYFSSKGHDAPALYAVLTALGRLPFDHIHKLRRIDGLPGHPDISTPHIVANTGSLGMGISKAKGFVRANRLQNRRGRIFVLLGDGELQEGQIWESLGSAANDGLFEIIAIVDHNKLQSDTFVEQTSALGDLEAKFKSFGWHTVRVDGHDLPAFEKTMRALDKIKDKPKMIIADTIKGCGVSFMEHTAMESDAALYRFHSGAPDAASYTRAAQELLDRVAEKCTHLGIEKVKLETVHAPTQPPAGATQKLIGAYAPALLEQMKRTPNMVVLDADLMVDTGQKPSKDAFPERFFECGIAEMDMVSQAGAMALGGLLPICHSFACFLSTRPNEQIYNNATERSKVIYVGSLAGILPGGPGHSHQSVRDISALGAVPGLVMMEPSCEQEVPLLLDYCVRGTQESAYLRLVSVPYEIPFKLPASYEPHEGRGIKLTEGRDAVIFGYGPVLLSEAYHAAQALREHHNLSVTLINFPWLNRVDSSWLSQVVADYQWVFTLDNHLVHGGQGSMLAAAIAEYGRGHIPQVHCLGVHDVPAFGSNDQVLRAHKLDRQSLSDQLSHLLRTSST